MNLAADPQGALHNLRKMVMTIAAGGALTSLWIGAFAMASEFTAAVAVPATQPHPIRAPGDWFRDCPACPEMVSIPGGLFVMGAGPEEEEREQMSEPFRHRSRPQREVTVRSFAAGKYEITRGQYRVFAEATQRAGDGCFVWTGNDFAIDPTKSWRDAGFRQDDTHPAVCVSWEDANAYAGWLSEITGKKYRLLSEAEWEYAARAGTATARYWGNDVRRSCEYANGADRTAQAEIPDAIGSYVADCRDRYAFTAPGGSYRANEFGLHDMLGNVGEWTQDCWNGDYQGAPRDGSARASGDCFMRAVRGGSWDDNPLGLRSAYRVGSPIVIRLYSRGFRVARDE
jgi:formylglycine-generating enzyme required for sulfatase activity